jgi:Tol biopolymer transport system component
VRLIVSLLLAVVSLPALAAGASVESYSMAIKQIGVDGKRRTLSIHEQPRALELSPDQTRFAFVPSNLNGGSSNELKVAKVNKASERLLLTAPGPIMDVAWAPNGLTLALSVAPARPDGVWGVWLVEANGSGLRRVADHFAFGLAWSPDSERLAMTRRIDNRPPNLIAVLSIDTGAVRDLAPGMYPNWSPDGSSILYEAAQANGSIEVHVVPAEGGESRRLANGWSPSWSPDGKRVAFHSSANGLPTALWVVPGRGGRPKLLVKWASQSVWTPSGRRLAVVSSREARLCTPRYKSTLGLVRFSGGNARRLLVTRRALDLLAWSHDSRRLFYTSSICPPR